MSGAISASTIIAGAVAALGVGASIYSTDQQRSTANKARDASNAQAQAALEASQQASSSAAQTGTQAAKAPTTPSAAASATGDTSGAGTSAASTLLTGSGGVDPTTLNLGKNTLLGSSSLLGQ